MTAPISNVSTLLRRILNEDAPSANHFSVENDWTSKLETQQLSIWEKRCKLENIVPNSADKMQLNWELFIKNVPNDGTTRIDMAIQDIRPMFTEFWKLVRDISGASMTNELEQCAYVMYKAATCDKSAARKSLEDYFGTIPVVTYGKLVRIAKTLKEWQLKYEKKTHDEEKEEPQRLLYAEYVSPFRHDNEDELLFDSDEEMKTHSPPPQQPPTTTQLSLHPNRTTDAPIDHNHEPFNRTCIEKQCEPYATYTDTGEILISAQDLASSLIRLLKSPSSNENIQGEVLNLIGLEGMEFISHLIQHRQCIVNDLEHGTTATTTKKNQPNLVGVSIQHQKRESQSQRKERQRLLLLQQQQQQQQALLDEHDHLGGGKLGGTGIQKRGIVLPSGSKRTHHQGYEEVYVPATIPTPLKEDELVPISSLPNYARIVLRNIKFLNRMQSQVYRCAFETNRNMLVCAPTGAGKTNVALLTVLHEIGQHIDNNGVLLTTNENMFKIIYVAPMKALAQEVQQKFQERLKVLGIRVRELTGDMQLTKKEIRETHMIVTTPEKWDVVTRKSGDGGSLMDMVKLLIIDEVHLLHEDRGPVIEILVARTIRQVERSQKMCRIVGLSATLPNYMDVASFLKANAKEGMFFFGNEYRPVPLTQYYIGVSEPNAVKSRLEMNRLAYEKMDASVKNGQQAMIFVHSRRDTVKTAEYLIECIQESDHAELFLGEYHTDYNMFKSKILNSRNKDLKVLVPKGIGIHHAGMTRPDRNIVEKAFKRGVLQCVVCTATLAWGVNLPAHTVIIKGTKIYDAKRGGFVELGMLDVMQIFGRAGRPQYDTTGEGVIITEHEQLNHYLSLINHQMPIESQFIQQLPDHLNAEITLGTVTNMNEAMLWLQYTYLFIRMLRNPTVYGISLEEKNFDPLLTMYRRKLILQAVTELQNAKMCRFNMKSEIFGITNLGRVASHYYINHDTIELFNGRMETHLNDDGICEMISSCREFEQLKTREEERDEMTKLIRMYCPIEIKTSIDENVGKANLLLQTYISNGSIRESTLISDLYYITQNAGRITRALFEISLRKSDAYLAYKLLLWCKMIDLRIWSFQHPLRQFRALKLPIIQKLEANNVDMHRLNDMSLSEISHIIRHQTLSTQIKKYCKLIPQLLIESNIQPITREVLRISIYVTCNFTWQLKLHGAQMIWWIWCEDPEGIMYHYESYTMNYAQHRETKQLIQFTIPIREPLPPQYYVRVINDRWLGSENNVCLSFKHLFLPSHRIVNTELLNLHPISTNALYNKKAQEMYGFTHFNPVQTQCFHTLYHTDMNVLLGAPTGSGKTIVGELAIIRLLTLYPTYKVVYIAPMKALARERVREWNKKSSLRGLLNYSVVELTGDSVPDAYALKHANIIITTPEKWDGISRGWRIRNYVRMVGLVLIDEIHLLGQDRGPILEVIVSRMRYISNKTNANVRIVGLSTALSNVSDVADWLGVEPRGLYNFEPKARPVPLTVHISGYSGKYYCPRMATMNKPTYMAIMNYSPTKPVIVFVSSRRQTRLTALDLINYTAASGDAHKFLHLNANETIDTYIGKVRDKNLRHCLAFGIGMHHAGLPSSDRAIVEDLFVSRKIQVLVCTSTLAWGVNFPAYLVVVKGTEYFDAKQGRYVDFPITDVLQMMGRAGRPQYDENGVACVLVHEPKKNFYLKFLHHPFPVESSLHKDVHLHDTFNAEVAVGTIKSIHDAVTYITWTFYFRRLLVNPTYYGFEDASIDGITQYLTEYVMRIMYLLYRAGCIDFVMMDEEYIVTNDYDVNMQKCAIITTGLGQIASMYYLHYTSVDMFKQRLTSTSSLFDLLSILSDANEYDELPVRHNEDKLNEELYAALPTKTRYPIQHDYSSSHYKTNLLLQAHFHQIQLPISDYITDTKSVLDQSMRILRAIVDVCANSAYLQTCIRTMHLTQMVVQGMFHHEKKQERLMKSQAIRFETCSYDEKSGRLCVVLNGKHNGVQKVKRSKLSRAGTNEGWWLVVGDKEHDHLYILKHIVMSKRRQTFYLQNVSKTLKEKLNTLYIISDAYIGIDHEIDLHKL